MIVRNEALIARVKAKARRAAADPRRVSNKAYAYRIQRWQRRQESRTGVAQ